MGSLRPDVRHRHIEEPNGSQETVATPERSGEGAWPESMDEVRFYAESAVTLPGMGEPGEECGEWGPTHFCAVCGEPHMGEYTCGKRVCPDCWGLWSRDRAEAGTVRLGAARYAADEPTDKRAVHAVFSPPEGDVRTLTDVRQGFGDVYDLAEEKGVRGGVAIFHGFRVTDDARAEWRRETDGGDDGPKLWRWVREHPKGWRSLTYWSPHWHVIGLCADFEADDPDAQDGWVARRLRSLDRFKLTDKSGYDDMAGCFRYVLSHMSFEPETQRDYVRWFGSLATSKFSPEEALSEGTLNVVKRKTAEVLETVPEDGEAGEEEAEGDTCGRGDCDGALKPIWDAGSALMDRSWTEGIDPSRQARLEAAFEWAIGEVVPPPGLRRPRTEDEAEEALSALVEGGP